METLCQGRRGLPFLYRSSDRWGDILFSTNSFVSCTYDFNFVQLLLLASDAGGGCPKNGDVGTQAVPCQPDPTRCPFIFWFSDNTYVAWLPEASIKRYFASGREGALQTAHHISDAVYLIGDLRRASFLVFGYFIIILNTVRVRNPIRDHNEISDKIW